MILNQSIMHDVLRCGGWHNSNIVPLHDTSPNDPYGFNMDHIEYLLNTESFEMVLRSADREVVRMRPRPSSFNDGAFSYNNKPDEYDSIEWVAVDGPRATGTVLKTLSDLIITNGTDFTLEFIINDGESDWAFSQGNLGDFTITVYDNDTVIGTAHYDDTMSQTWAWIPFSFHSDTPFTGPIKILVTGTGSYNTGEPGSPSGGIYDANGSTEYPSAPGNYVAPGIACGALLVRYNAAASIPSTVHQIGTPQRWPGVNDSLPPVSAGPVLVNPAYGIRPMGIDVRPGFSGVAAMHFPSGGVTPIPMQEARPGPSVYTRLKWLWFNSIGLMGTVDSGGETVEITEFDIIVKDMLVYDRNFFPNAFVKKSDSDTKIPLRTAGETIIFSGTVAKTSGGGDLIIDEVLVRDGDIVRIPNLGISIGGQDLRPRLKI